MIRSMPNVNAAAMSLVRYCRTKIRESTFKRSFIFVQIFEWNLARSLSKMFHHKLVKPVWPDYKFICLVFGHLHQLKFVRWQIKFAKIISKFCKIRCEPVQNGQSFYHCPKVAKFHQIWLHWLKLRSNSKRVQSPIRVLLFATRSIVLLFVISWNWP